MCHFVLYNVLIVVHALKEKIFKVVMFLNILAGEVPKQVKVKKLKNLKTLDSKPGNKLDHHKNIILTIFFTKNAYPSCFLAVFFFSSRCLYILQAILEQR